MDFIKRNWSTLIVIGALAAYLGISMGTDKCPMCVATGLVFGSSTNADSTSKPTEVVGETGSLIWSVESIEGKKIDHVSAKGKVSILVYWATWCAPCREEIPALIALREEFPESELEIIGISLDEASKSIESFVTTNRINYDIARNNQSLEDAFGPIRYIPTIVILDREGKIQQRYTGLVGQDVIRGQVESLIANEVVARL